MDDPLAVLLGWRPRRQIVGGDAAGHEFLTDGDGRQERLPFPGDQEQSFSHAFLAPLGRCL
jgi:hypothetical protein